MGITDQLTKYVLSTRYENLPGQVVTEAKKGFLDFLGVAIVGSREPSTRILLNASGALTTRGEATILGTRVRTLPAVAALVNGHAAHALDYDDTQPGRTTHISAPVLAATLAVAENARFSGKKVLSAYIAGFEIGCRLGRSARFGHHLIRNGIHPIGILGHVGAVAAVGHIVGLAPLQMNYGFALAASQAAGLVRSFGTMCKPLQVAKAAHDAVFSAELARRGFSAAEGIFEGEHNLFSIYGGKTDPKKLTLGLGQNFEIMENTIKVFACAGWRNSIVEASILLSRNHNLKAQEVKEVVIWAPERLLKLPNYEEPRTGLEGKFSSQHAAAVGLVDHGGGIEQFSDARVADPGLAKLRRRIRMKVDASLGNYQIRMEVKMVDGRKLSHFVPARKGTPRNPLTWEELVEKFRANARLVLPEKQVNAVLRMVQDLEKLKDIRGLMRPAKTNIKGKERIFGR